MELVDLLFFLMLFIFISVIFGLSIIATIIVMLINETTPKRDKNEHKQNIRR